MATVTVTKEDFDTVVSSKDIVLVDFWASCGVWALPGVRPGLREGFGHSLGSGVCQDRHRSLKASLAAAFDIMSIPTLMILRDKVIVYREAGALPAPALDELIGKVRDLDMDVIHRRYRRVQRRVDDPSASQSRRWRCDAGRS